MARKLKIAVLGGGHGCYAAAADMTEAGHEVRFWRRDAVALKPVLETGAITLKDHKGSRAVKPALAQEGLAKALSPHVTDGQVLFIPPGTFGSYLMLKVMRSAGSKADIAIAESGTLPWLTRKHGPAEIAITTRATRLPTGVFPARHSAQALQVIRAAFPNCIEPVEDALSAALMNAGPIIHPPLILMNAAPIEHFPRWDIHKEGTQPSVRRVHDALDAERIAVRVALGYAAPHFPLADHYTTSNWMYGNLAHEKLVVSGDWHEKLDLSGHRYMAEDIGLGLAFLVSVARHAGVAVPTAAALLQLGSLAARDDFLKTGRTLANLGLGAMSRAELASLLHKGL